MDKTGSPEYKVRRVKHWFKKDWTSLEPAIQIIEEVEDSIISAVLSTCKDAHYPILLFLQDQRHWCLLDLRTIYYRYEGVNYSIPVSDIAHATWSWGQTPFEEQERLEQRIKLSQWIALRVSPGGKQYDLYVGNSSTFMINVIQKIHTLNDTYGQ